jgi:hypothetical protein
MNPFNFFGNEEQKKIIEQAKKLGPEKIMAVQQEWPKLIAEAKLHMEKGTDPKSPEVQALAKRWMELVGQFTGGDQKVQQGLSNMYKEKGGELKQKFGGKVPDWEAIEYIMKALA